MKRTQSFLIPVPLSLDEYTMGYRYTLCKVFLDEINEKPEKASKINIIKSENIKGNSEFGNCKYTEKLIDVAPKVPAIVTSIFSRKAFIMREKSYNNFIKCRTEYMSEYFDIGKYHLVVESFIKESSNFKDEYIKSITNDQMYMLDKNFLIDIGTNENDAFPKKFSLTDKLRKNWFLENLDNLIVVKKSITAKVNMFGLGWIAKKIIKGTEENLKSLHKRILFTKNEWEILTEADIKKLEDDVDNKIRESFGEIKV